MTLNLRPATESDAIAVAEVYLRSRKELVACAPLVHSDRSVYEWVVGKLIPAGNVTVASIENIIVGFVAVSRDSEFSWIEQLYVAPAYLRRGVGTMLLAHAKSELSPPIRLYTFECNDTARRFYEHHGFNAIGSSDGRANEEYCPDILYEWR